MTPLNPDQLLTLARVYSEATGLTLGTVGKRACNGNHHFFNRLAKGRNANALGMMRAVEWFSANWPDNAEWPKGIPGKPNFQARSPQPPIWDDQAFKRWVREGAKARGMPVYKVLEAAGLNKFYLNETSKGRSPNAVLNLAHVLKISPAPLFGLSADIASRREKQGKKMPKLQPNEESDLLEVSSVQDQPGEFKLRLRIDRVISGQLAIRILQMIGEDAVNVSRTGTGNGAGNSGKQGPA